MRLADKRIFPSTLTGWNPRYLSTGHIVYTLPNGTVMAARSMSTAWKSAVIQWRCSSMCSSGTRSIAVRVTLVLH